MPLGYMICMEMFGNGVKILGMMIMIYYPRMDRLGYREVIAVVASSGVAHGGIQLITAVRLSAPAMPPTKAIALQVFGLP